MGRGSSTQKSTAPDGHFLASVAFFLSLTPGLPAVRELDTRGLETEDETDDY
jgi:hypothetical protein